MLSKVEIVCGVIIALSSCFAKAQNNLILNGSFETPFGFGTSNVISDHWSLDADNGQAASIIRQNAVEMWRDPTQPVVLPTPIVAWDASSNCPLGSQEPSVNGGSSFAALIANWPLGAGGGNLRRGKIGQHLNQALVKGNEYLLKFKVSKMDNSTKEPRLRVYIHSEFGNTLNYNDVFNKKIINDGSPSNTPNTWQEVSIIFTPDEQDQDWIIFKVHNELLAGNWTGVYIDNVELYDLCDYMLYMSGTLCYQSTGEYNVRARPVDEETGILYHMDNEPFHIINLDNVTDVQLNIINQAGSLVSVVSRSSPNGIREPIYWDGRVWGGAETAAGWYLANGYYYNYSEGCIWDNKTWVFFKGNGMNTTSIPVDNDLTNGGTVTLDGPIAYSRCCAFNPNYYINNEHFHATDLGSDGIVGEYTYQASESITFGPNILTDPNTLVNLKAPNVINLVSPLNVRGALNVQLTGCPGRYSAAGYYSQDEDLDSIFSIMPDAIAFPNPSNSGTFTIRILSKDTRPREVKAFDIYGKEVRILVAWHGDVVNVEFLDRVSGIYNIQIGPDLRKSSLRVCVLN